MNIPLIGKSAAADISKTFGGDAEKLLNAVDDGYDFSKIEGFGSIMNDELQKWFADKEKRAEFEHILSLRFLVRLRRRVWRVLRLLFLLLFFLRVIECLLLDVFAIYA